MSETASVVFILLVVIVIGSIVSIEIWLFAWRIARKKNVHISYFLAATAVLRADSDMERQNAIIKFSLFNIVIGTVIFILTILSVFLIALPYYLSEGVRDSSIAYISATFFVAMGYFLLRKRFFSVSDVSIVEKSAGDGIFPGAYSFFDQVLHWVALESKSAREIAFYMDVMFVKIFKPVQLKMRRHNRGEGAVYVCGLARSGTTMLLETLSQSPAFFSLTYSSMPFVMSPNIWKFISDRGNRKQELRERAHGDGIKYGFNTPESFEEVFWKTFVRERKAFRTILIPVIRDDLSPNSEIIKQRIYALDKIGVDVLKKFSLYRSLVALSCGCDGYRKRYLSKNNDNLLRFKLLASEPDSRVLVVYRNPLDTAISLYRQHKRFCEIQTKDPFVVEYMSWLGHYEFGLNHRPFGFAISRMKVAYSPEEFDYWVDYWSAVYAYVIDELKNDCSRVVLINHDSICNSSDVNIRKLFEILRVNKDFWRVSSQYVKGIGNDRAMPLVDKLLVDKAMEIYEMMETHPSNLMNLATP